MQTTKYRTESGHAPGEVTPEGVGILHGHATKHKQRRHRDGTYHFGAGHHFHRDSDRKHAKEMETFLHHLGWHHVESQRHKSKSNAAENDLMLLEFNNVNWANVGDAVGLRGSTTAGSFFVNIHTADPGETGDQTTSKIAYTNYLGYVPVARTSGGWTVSGTAPTQAVNVGAVTFEACGASGATAAYFTVGRSSSSTGEIVYSGALTAPLIINAGITPSFPAGALQCTED